MRAIRAGLLLLVALVPAWFQGAPAYAQSEASHWAYKSPIRPTIPDTALPSWTKNSIDSFTHAMMTQHGLVPSPEAVRHTLIRRVTLDLTGLPPTPYEVARFLADRAPDAYERLVDRLLQSPRFGEQMATHWLDLARYADTHGYHMDAHREMWRWRDWVIEAYNTNMPFDQFTIEQLAGDLLPNANLSQQIATGFNRNNMVNFENGTIADEFLAEYAIDRVTTTSTVWLGQTMVCARCHDHKYDPFTQREFYQLVAFFDQVPEKGVDGDKGNAAPSIKAPLAHQSELIERLTRRSTELELSLQEQRESAEAGVAAWEKTLQVTESRSVAAKPRFSLAFEQTEGVLDRALRGSRTFIAGKLGDALVFDGQTYVSLSDQVHLAPRESVTVSLWLFPTTRGPMVVLSQTSESGMSFRVELDGGKVLLQLVRAGEKDALSLASDSAIVPSRWHHVAVCWTASEIAVFVNGSRVATTPLDAPFASNAPAKTSLTVGSDEAGRSFRGMLDELRVYAQRLADEEIAILAGGDPIGEILAVPSDNRTEVQAARLKRYYLEHVDADYRAASQELEAVSQLQAEVTAILPTTMVMQDASERKPTYVLKNGHYDSPGEVVEPGVPNVLPPLPGSRTADRLALAQWLVQGNHPLTARVAVNHLWQQFFGAGLVRTPEDFGTRGERPTHPALLDWLATEFTIDWDVKRIVKLIVTSATYRQSDHATPELAVADPENRWLARASRLRLGAEAIRDSALSAGGLLVERTGGPSVFPYQPDGLWEEIAYNANDFTAQVYRQSHGEDLYRRSLYTFVKRSVPSPTLVAFDAPNRETCVARRPRTNTPQQALVLMNDVTFVEAARTFAGRTLAACDSSKERIDHLFLVAMSRHATQVEQQIFAGLINDLRHSYAEQPSLADSLISVGESSVCGQIDPIEIAVWTAVANVVLSLDEVVTRP